MYILIGIFIYFLFSMIFHLHALETNLVSLCKFYKNSKLSIFISPDLYFAKQGKYMLKNKYDNSEILFMPEIFNIRPSNEHTANAIISWNSKNLKFSIFFFIVISVLSYIKLNKNFLYFCTAFFAYRCISRSFEIGSAFFKDITDSKMKNPFLNSNKRIILASKSYIEIIFNFATLNLLGEILSDRLKSDHFKYFFETLENKKILFVDVLLKSFGITTFTNASVTSLSGVIQIITTLILVLFALAGYLNNKGDNK